MTCGRTTFVAVPVVAMLILGSTISSGLTTYKSLNGGLMFSLGISQLVISPRILKGKSCSFRDNEQFSKLELSEK